MSRDKRVKPDLLSTDLDLLGSFLHVLEIWPKDAVPVLATEAKNETAVGM